MLQPGRLVAQHVAGRPFADRLHLVEEHVVGSVLQRQQLGNAAASSERESGVKGSLQESDRYVRQIRTDTNASRATISDGLFLSSRSSPGPVRSPVSQA